MYSNNHNITVNIRKRKCYVQFQEDDIKSVIQQKIALKTARNKVSVFHTMHFHVMEKSRSAANTNHENLFNWI